MRCPSCAADVEATHRFCHQCAAPLAGVTPLVPVDPAPVEATPVNVVPLPIVAATDAPPVPTLPGRAEPLAAPTLAPPPTFQPVPGGAPQPPAPLPVPGGPPPADLPATQPLPIVAVPSAPPEPIRPPAVPDDTPRFIGLDSKGDPVPPPPLSVGEPVLSSAVTEALPVVEQTEGADWSAETVEQPAVTARSGSTAVLPVVDEHRFRLTALLVLAVLTSVLAVSAGVLDVVSYLVTGTDSAARTLLLDDLSSNHLIGIGIGVFLLLVGAVVGATGRRSGAGLAGGAALGLAGLLVNAVGLGVDMLDEVEVTYLGTPGNTITSTREIGFFLAIGAAGLAGLSFCTALAAARGGGRPRLVLVLLGIIATAAAVVGPLIPMNGAAWVDNWSQDGVPDATMWLRLAALTVLLIAGVTAFAIGGRFGGSMALGAMAIAVFQSLTAYLDLGDRPLGVANGNFFAADGGLEIEPHLVTLAGIMAVVLLGVVAIMVPTRRTER